MPREDEVVRGGGVGSIEIFATSIFLTPLLFFELILLFSALLVSSLSLVILRVCVHRNPCAVLIPLFALALLS